MANPIQAQTLGNGLMVITREVHDAPVAALWTWYRVGARNEVAGITGISHWVEHMMFKGTPSLSKGEIFRSVSKNGGTLNGFTWLDFTAYYETLPSDRLDLALRLESDRMVNSTFDPPEVASERTVIISEREGDENLPSFHLDEEVNAAAFKAHPYGHGVIGWRGDLESMTRDDLYSYYRSHYVPNNAVVVAVGDFDTGTLLARVEELFGPIPPSPVIPTVRSTEPPQQGERRVIVERHGPTRYFAAAYHAPAATSPDIYPLFILDAILSGAKPMGLFAGRDTSMGRSSRLYRRLVDSGGCSVANSAFGLTRDPYVFGISATLRPAIALMDVERAIFDEIDRIMSDGVRPDEVEKAIKQVEAQFIYGSEGVTNQAYWLGSLEMVSQYTMLVNFVERISAVTPADVQRVARIYLLPTNRTVGWFEPTAFDDIINPSGSTTRGVKHYYYRNPGVASGPALEIRRQQLPNGITILGHERSGAPAVVVRASAQAGAMYDPLGKEGLAYFTARMTQRGTNRHTFQEISELTDRVGASLNVESGPHSFQASGRSLRGDLDLVVGLLAEVVREPIFPPEEIDKTRGQILTRLREQEDDTRTTVERRFRELAYPADHPYHHWPLGDEASVASLTREDLVNFHRRYVQPSRTSIVYSGDMSFDEFIDTIARAFAGWNDHGPSDPFAIPDAPRPSGLIRRDVVFPAKVQSDLGLGLPSLRRMDPDFYVLTVVDLILGGLGLSGRLGTSVRDQLGLAYYIFSNIDRSIGPTPWGVRAGVNPANLERAIEVILQEIAQIRTEPVTETEITDAKSYLTGVLPLSLETNDGVTNLLQRIEMFDLGLDYLDRYPGIINALTREQVRDAAYRYLSTAQLVVVTAGPAIG